MQSNVLLKNLLLSSSDFNRLRFEKDKKQRGKVIGSIVGKCVLDLMLLSYCVAMSLGFGVSGLTKFIPVTCAVSVAALEFFLCLFKTNGYIFSLSDYEMTMSLPISVKRIVATRFMYMYLKNISWVFLISVPMMISYGVFVHPSVAVYPLWMVLTFFLPMIPMLLATALGTCIAALGARSRHKTLVQTILTFALVLVLFALRFVIEDIARDEKIIETMETVSVSLDKIKAFYFPALWFENAIINLNVLDVLYFVALSILIFELVFSVISKFYRQIVSRLMTGAHAKSFTLKGLEVRSVPHSVAFKELRCMLGSTNYIVNMGLGYILCVIFCVFAGVLGFDRIIMFFTHGNYVDTKILIPAIPMIVFFMVGMVATTSCSYSLEGKNLWIMQSLPVSRREFISGKMLFNLYLSVPFAILGNFVLALSAGASVLETVFCIVCGVIQCVFATNWGMFANLLFPKFNWKSDIEVIKQGASVAVYMLPNMFLTMGLGVVAVMLGFKTGAMLAVLCVTALYFLLAGLSYAGVLIKVRK